MFHKIVPRFTLSVATLRRDPAAPGRALALTLGILLFWQLGRIGEFQPGRLLEPGNLRVMGNFLQGFYPPATDRDFLSLLARATLETLAIATAGIALALLLALPLSLLISQALSLSRLLPGPRRPGGILLRQVLRGLTMVLRGIPELVWALALVRVFGLGPAAGVLALALTYGGMLAKVYAEILESGDRRAARAIVASGGGRLAALGYGLLPGVAQELVSYTVYRWECALRAAVVMGFVGAGGLGQLMDQAMKMLNGGEAAAILLAFLLLVLAADGFSALLRRGLETVDRRRPAALGPLAWGLLLGLALAVAASFRFLELGLSALASVDTLTQVLRFAADFFPVDFSSEWRHKVFQGSLQTIAISALGTLLAMALGLLLALPSSRLWRGVTRLVLNTLRSVPELVWATLMVLAAGLGPFAGTLALALHTTGVLGRLFAEALENTPRQPRDALAVTGSRSFLAFLYGTLPGVLPQLAAYSLYRWEMNIRMAAILGFVGAGGLGQLLYVELSLFHYAQASTVIGAMLLLSLMVDGASAALRRRL
ncbi:phosphonate ABC transporter, permease protein PhnE [Denitratisoma oestradiolicum]|nr:phosphonate ABC transporter, permease protein PhnE [Denitratisoma oestradiolicum]